MSIQQEVLNTIVNNPGLTPRAYFDKMPGVRYNTLSSMISNLHKAKLVKREPVDNSNTFTYLPTELAYVASNGKAAKKRAVRRAFKRGKTQAGVLVVIQYGRNESITLSMDDAEEVSRYLNRMFPGNK
jgi:hypothetical protein